MGAISNETLRLLIRCFMCKCHFIGMPFCVIPSRELTEPEHQGVAGMMAAFFLILGIFCGVIFSLPVTVLVEKLWVEASARDQQTVKAKKLSKAIFLLYCLNQHSLKCSLEFCTAVVCLCSAEVVLRWSHLCVWEVGVEGWWVCL